MLSYEMKKLEGDYFVCVFHCPSYINMFIFSEIRKQDEHITFIVLLNTELSA